jgi:hypothetical protein
MAEIGLEEICSHGLLPLSIEVNVQKSADFTLLSLSTQIKKATGDIR